MGTSVGGARFHSGCGSGVVLSIKVLNEYFNPDLLAGSYQTGLVGGLNLE